jgi:hypothetical protein
MLHMVDVNGRRRRQRWRLLGSVLGAAVLGWLGAAACISPENETSLTKASGEGRATGDADGGAQHPGSASGGGTGSGLFGFVGEDPTPSELPDGACAASSYQAEQIVTQTTVEVPVTIEVEVPVTVEVEVPVTTVINEPVAFYIMLDQSGSMSDTSGSTSKWNAAVSSITTFVNDPNSTGLDVAFNEFAGGIAFLDFNCSGSQYSNPLVAMGALPGNAQNVVNALASTAPTGLGTNIEPGLRAATDGCIAHQTATGERCIVIFVSDGQPNVCSTDANLLASIAGDAYTQYGVQTFMVAMAGSDFNLMNQIAVAGGTDCDPNGPNNACDIQNDASAFIDALNQIRETTVVTEYITETRTEFLTEYHTETRTEVQTSVISTPVECEWVLPAPPDGETMDVNKVNVDIAVGTQTQRLGYIASSEECQSTGGGWYYDDATAPTKILVCDETCGVIQAVPETRVDLLLGCETQVAIPR